MAPGDQFFGYLNDICENKDVSYATYMRRFEILKDLPPYRDSLKILKRNDVPAFASLDANVNLGGLVTFLLGQTSVTINFRLESCANSPSQTSAAKTLSCSLANVTRNPSDFKKIITKKVAELTKKDKGVACSVENCNSIQKRVFEYTGKEI